MVGMWNEVRRACDRMYSDDGPLNRTRLNTVIPAKQQHRWLFISVYDAILSTPETYRMVTTLAEVQLLCPGKDRTLRPREPRKPPDT